MSKKEAWQGKPLLYGVFDSPLGKAMVATTPAGVCAIAFADREKELYAELQERFPQCAHCQDGQAIAPLASALVNSVSGGAALHLRLDVKGTAFQLRVWGALQTIPRGATRTYTEVAQAIGLSATSARAVAQACATNPVALAIPCHRVVGTDGELRGYRWGMERKRQLLLLERSGDLLPPVAGLRLH